MKYCYLFLLSLCAHIAYAQPPQSIVFGVHSTTAPLEWRDNGIDQGFHLELMAEIGRLINKRIIVRRKSFEQVLADVHQPNGEIDVVAVVSPISTKRQLSQSDPIYATHARAYTLQGVPLINSWDDLTGKRVAIKKGAFVDIYIAKQAQAFKRVDVDLYETGFQQLISGKVDVVLAENFVARRLQPFYPSIRSSSDALIYGAFNFVSNPTNAALMTEINDALRQLKLSGEYDVLVNKWFGTGREKVDLTSTQQSMFRLAIFVSIISALGMLLTGYFSYSSQKSSRALTLELTQRKKTELQLANLSQQFQSMLDGIPHGVTLFNRECTRLWSNDNNELLSSDELRYTDGSSFELKSILLEVLDNQKSIIADMNYQSQFWQLQIHPISQDQAVILLEETSEQHRLRQANDEASRLASLGELSAGIAHEINNPTGIIIHATAFVNDALKDLHVAAQAYQTQNPFWLVAGLEPLRAITELEYSSQTIDEAANRISNIVNDLKHYAMPTLNINHQAISLNDVVQVSLRLTANQIKRFRVRTQLCEPAPYMQGDAQQLHQVLINLIQNACHACLPDDGSDNPADCITIATRIIHGAACMIVTDTGCGMDETTLQRITEPFFTTRRSIGGSGLGLSVCSRIIKEHNGEMQISSKLGLGTCVKLIFSSQISVES